MLLALQSATDTLLKAELPSVFTGAGAAALSFAGHTWEFDRASADPIAGEPGPQDAVDDLLFNPLAAAGPYLLTRPPYPGPKRVYLRSPGGELVALGHQEIVWNAADSRSFSLAPRAGRALAGFDRLRVLYGVVAAATKLKMLHRINLTVTAVDAAAAERAFSLALSTLTMNREALLAAGGFAWTADGYQVAGSVKSLSFATGSSPAANARSLALTAEVDLLLERLLAADEGRPIARIFSPGHAAGTRPVAIDPAVEA